MQRPVRPQVPKFTPGSKTEEWVLYQDDLVIYLADMAAYLADRAERMQAILEKMTQWQDSLAQKRRIMPQ